MEYTQKYWLNQKLKQTQYLTNKLPLHSVFSLTVFTFEHKASLQIT